MRARWGCGMIASKATGTSPAKPRRRPISQRMRFEVFKRDQFTCVYCGSHPPASIMQIDHIEPVSKGGGNDLDNLVTSCSTCNLGKSNKLLSSVPESLAEKAKRIKEREKQIAGYRAIMDAALRRQEWDVDLIEKVFIQRFGFEFSDSFRATVRNQFLRELDVYVLIEHAEKACSRIPEIERAISYFCGINWRVIKGDV